MKFVCSKSNLLTGVQTVAKAVPSKTTMSILECILIEADNGNIILTANDMELGIETIIKGDVLVSGKIIAKWKKMQYNMIKWKRMLRNVMKWNNVSAKGGEQ